MSLKTQLATDLAIFFNIDEFADEATYTPKGGAPFAIKVVPVFNRNLEILQNGQKNTADFHVRKDQVPNPVFGDTITHNSLAWTIEAVATGGDGRVSMLMCRRAERVKL